MPLSQPGRCAHPNAPATLPLRAPLTSSNRHWQAAEDGLKSPAVRSSVDNGPSSTRRPSASDRPRRPARTTRHRKATTAGQADERARPSRHRDRHRKPRPVPRPPDADPPVRRRHGPLRPAQAAGMRVGGEGTVAGEPARVGDAADKTAVSAAVTSAFAGCSRYDRQPPSLLGAACAWGAASVPASAMAARYGGTRRAIRLR